MFRLTDDQRMRPLLDGVTPQRRQDTDKVWSLSGAVYVAEVPWFRENRRFVTPETVGYVMPSERSVDIDTLIDVMMAEALMPEAQIEANSPDTAE